MNGTRVSTCADMQGRLDAFQRSLERYRALTEVPGFAVGVAEGDRLLYFKGFGHADCAARKPIAPDTVFGLASVTKTFTAVALKQLEEGGRMSLSDPIDRFPNRFFTERRFSAAPTIGQIISHTSESRPCGTLFVYNGGLYNLVFNVFDHLTVSDDPADPARPFTQTIDQRIVEPLGLDHTITRAASGRFAALRDHLATPHVYDADARAYAVAAAPPHPTSYPATGIMSSVDDLVRYSHALAAGRVISQRAYAELTRPFYEDQNGVSPYAEGWFNTTFEGVEMHWAYGYGDTDASLLLRIPANELTLVFLANANVPAAAALLGYGNPLNSLVVCSFLSTLVWGRADDGPATDHSETSATVRRHLSNAVRKSGSRLALEEAFAYAMTLTRLPEGLAHDSEGAARILRALGAEFPDFFHPDRTEAFDLLADFDGAEVADIGRRLAEVHTSRGIYHPIRTFYSGRLFERAGDHVRATRAFQAVADAPGFSEQGVKHRALLYMGKHWATSDPHRARRYLEELLWCKEMVGARDQQHQEAMDALTSLRDGTVNHS